MRRRENEPDEQQVKDERDSPKPELRIKLMHELMPNRYQLAHEAYLRDLDRRIHKKLDTR